VWAIGIDRHGTHRVNARLQAMSPVQHAGYGKNSIVPAVVTTSGRM
jgi:hypothetical protein